MSSAEPERETAAAGRLIERLLVDPVFRGEFRRDPVGACVAAGLPGLARELGGGVGSGMQTLELRESRSSLAGVVMAAAVEGLSVAEAQAFVEHGAKGLKLGHGVKLPHGVRAPSGVAKVQGLEHKVVGRAHHEVKAAERVAGGQAGRAGAPGAAGSGSSGAAAPGSSPAAAPGSSAAGSPGTPGSGAAGSHAAVSAGQGSSGGAAPAAQASGVAGHGGAAAGSSTPAASAASVASAPAATGATPAGSATPGSSLPWPDAPGAGGGSASGAPAGAVASMPGGGAPAGAVASMPGGGAAGAAGAVAGAAGAPVSPAVVLESPALQASPQAKAFLASGGADPRVVSLLGSVLSHHQVGVASVVSASSPVHVQTLEIVSVDGQPVGPDNFAARDLVTEIAAMSPGVRPDEIGTPWPIQSPGFFSDQSSQASLHLAFEMPGANAQAAAAVPAGGAVPGAQAVPGAVYPAPGAAVPGAAVPGAASYPAAAYPAAAAPAGVQPAVAGVAPSAGVPAAPGTAVPATTTAPGSTAADQAQQLAGSGAVSLAADPTASAKVSAMVRFADSIVGKPYIIGGGHGGWGPQSGYDCSGFVSAVLHAAGYLTHPVDTTLMPSQPGIEAGPGKFVTIFDRALPGQSGHVIIEINGQFYESGGRHGPWGGGGGVMKIGKPDADYLATFPNVLHPQGL